MTGGGGPRYSKDDDLYIISVLKEHSTLTLRELAAKIAPNFPGRTISGLHWRLRKLDQQGRWRARATTRETVAPDLGDRPLLQMLKILWDSRRMSDDKLKGQYIKAAEVVNQVYEDIGRARLEIEKMRPAYLKQIEAEQAALDTKMTECADAIRSALLVDREVKR